MAELPAASRRDDGPAGRRRPHRDLGRHRQPLRPDARQPAWRCRTRRPRRRPPSGPAVVFIDTWDVLAGRDGGWADYVIDPRDGLGKAVRMARRLPPQPDRLRDPGPRRSRQPSAPTSPREATSSDRVLQPSEGLRGASRRRTHSDAANPRMRSAGGGLDHRPGQGAAHLSTSKRLGDEPPEAPAGPVVDVARRVAPAPARSVGGPGCRPARSARTAPTPRACPSTPGPARPVRRPGPGTCSSTSMASTRSKARSGNGSLVASPNRHGSPSLLPLVGQRLVGEIEARPTAPRGTARAPGA